MSIRSVQRDDLGAIEKIYQHYVDTSIATFEESTERSTDFHKLYDELEASGLPFLASVDGDTITGYALVKPYHVRAAYRFTVEDSIYVHPGYAGRGLGRKLLSELTSRLHKSPVKQVVAAMSISPDVQERDFATCRLHRSFGFIPAGRLTAVGYKFDKWIDVVYYQLDLDQSQGERSGELSEK